MVGLGEGHATAKCPVPPLVRQHPDFNCCSLFRSGVRAFGKDLSPDGFRDGGEGERRWRTDLTRRDRASISDVA